jgi:4-amino-4-deoxy-L-arabinose transferase-like glycosyltransferase
MAHNPVNHPLRPFYRALGALAGAWLVLLGIVGIITNAGDDFFTAHPERVLGQGVNLFGSIISLVTGAVVVIVTIIGRNLDTETYKFLGWAVLAVASYGLATARTDANFLGFTISTVVVDYLVGLVLVLAGLYIKSAPRTETGNPRQVREEVRSA